jgi:hypothetical protein
MDTGALPVELEALAGLESAMAHAQQALGEGVWHLAEPEVLDVLRRVHRLNARVQSLQLGVVREAVTRGIPSTVGATSTRAFLSAALTMSPGLAGEHAKLAEAFAGKFADTGAALAAGTVSYEHARAIVDVVAGLPEKATVEQKAKAEGFLLAKSAELNATDLRSWGKLIDAVIDPDGIADREEAARSKRGASVRDNNNGTQTLTWTDIDEHIAMAKAAIEALSAPVPGEDGERDPRSAAERRADALVELCRQSLEFGDLGTSRGVRPHLHVTFTEATLRGEPGAPFGRTSTGEYLSPATIARLACDADITGILLDGAGVPLKVGRTRRTVTHGQWIALVARDTGCQFTGCTRPARWCQAHHLTPWAQHGNTDLDDLGLYCGVHHHYLHDRGWRAQMGPDGRPELIPPPWIDQLQKPRRNQYWSLQREYLDFTTDPDP